MNPALTIACLKPVFDRVRSRLVPLLERSLASSTKIDDSFLYHSYDTGRQVEFGRLVLMAMGYDFERGRTRSVGPSFYHVVSIQPMYASPHVYTNTNYSPACSVVSMKAGMDCMTRGWITDHYGTPIGRIRLPGHP